MGRQDAMAHERQRDDYFDNLRFVLVLLVVIGHAVEPQLGQGRAVRALYLWMYAFHIPAFAFVSGFFTRGLERPGYLKNVVVRLAPTLIVFQLLYASVNGWQLPKATPIWVLWFLASLLCWKLALPIIVRLRYPVLWATAAAVGAGYVSTIGYPFSASRTLVFFPFFVAGQFLDASHLVRLRTWKVRCVSVSILAALGAAAYAFAPALDARWLCGSHSYLALSRPEWWAGALRLGLLVVSAAATAAVMAIIPTGRTAFSRLGSRTLYVFLWHGLVIRAVILAGVYTRLQSAQGVAIAIVGAVALTFVLASPAVRWCTRFLVEPHTLLRRRDATPGRLAAG